MAPDTSGQVIHGLIPATAGRHFRIIYWIDATSFFIYIKTTKWSNHEYLCAAA
jgi:hypothetical protein